MLKFHLQGFVARSAGKSESSSIELRCLPQPSQAKLTMCAHMPSLAYTQECFSSQTLIKMEDAHS